MHISSHEISNYSKWRMKKKSHKHRSMFTNSCLAVKASKGMKIYYATSIANLTE